MYLFVEFWVDVEAKKELDVWPCWVYGSVHFPSYSFDEISQTLSYDQTYLFGRFQPHDNDWGIMGRQEIRWDDAGYGVGNYIVAIDKLPYTTTIPVFIGKVEGMGKTGELHAYPDVRTDLPVILRAISETGTLVTEIGGDPIVLGLEDSWKYIVEADIYFDCDWISGDGRYRVTSSITNHGWVPRSKIEAHR